MLARFAIVLLFAAALLGQQSSPAPPPKAPSGSPSATTNRIAGTVVNSLTGQPVASASVAIAPTIQGADREISKSYTTGPDGRFVFSGLSRGKYSLMAEARGFSLQYFEHHDPYASAVAVGPDLETAQIVFRLEPDASIEGAVTDENNDPVQNALVRLFQKNTDGGEQKTLPVNQSQTDDQGRYHIGHLAPGTYYLAVSSRPWYAQNTRPGNHGPNNNSDAASATTSLDVTYPLTFYPQAADSASASPLQLTPGEKASADVVLRAVPSLHLRIHLGGSAPNEVLGRMVFPHVSQRVFEGYLDSVFNAPDSWVGPGVIEIAGLAPGHYVIEFPPSSGSGDKGGSRGWYKEIDLAGDAEINASDGPSFTSVGGTILFEGLPRVPHDASIQLSNPETGEAFRSDLTERGDFDFHADDVRPGRYTVLLENANGFYLRKLSATGARIIGRTIDIGAAASVRIIAVASRGAAQVEGTAMREGEPFAGAMIVLIPQDPAHNSPLFRRDQSDTDGTFTLANVVPGHYTAIAIANGWDLEWANPTVLQPYLAKGEPVEVPVEGKLQIKVQVQ